jgi:NAD(P)-dependent dehydrogenase (short-subunit alcohol dehydrogenase family)
VAVSRSPDELEQVAAEVRALGRNARPVALDVTHAKSIRHLVSGLPRVDVLVISAGANAPKPLLDVSDDQLDALLALNVRAVFVTLQAAARRMVEAGGGSIVLISSQMGHVGAEKRSVYCTTKHAVEGLTKAAAVELAPHRVRVNAVAPTFVETPMTAPFLADAEFRADVERRIPLGRLGRVEDVTGAVVYLASDASALVTGTSLLVDGGWTAQ